MSRLIVTRFCGAALVAAVGGATPASLIGQETRARLHLVEMSAQAVDGFNAISGVAIAENSSALIVWSASGSNAAVVRAGKPTILARGRIESPVSAAFVAADSVVELIDAKRRSVLCFNGRTGEFLRETRLDIAGTIEAAAHDKQGWVVAGVGSNEDVLLHRLDPRGHGITLHKFSLAELGYPRGLPVHLSRAPEGFLVTQVSPPYRVFRFSNSGRIASVFEGSAAQGSVLLEGAPGTTPTRVSMPALSVGSGFLQTIADLRSNRRFLVSYDHSGRWLQSISLDVPIAFTTTRNDPPLLVAVRELGVPEIVTYTYRWELR